MLPRRAAMVFSVVMAGLCLAAAPVPTETAAATETASQRSSEDAADRFIPPPSLKRHGWYARIETTKGRILLRLLPRQAPRSVAYFAALAEGTIEWIEPVTGEEVREPFYDGALIHKAIGGERFEAGNVRVDGRYAPDVYVPMEGAGPVSFMFPYRAGMLVESSGDISGVSFFVTSSADTRMIPHHPCFAEVVGGTQVVDEIVNVRTNKFDKPIEPVVIEKIRLFKVGNPGPLPEPVYHRRELMPMEPSEALKEKKRRRMSGAK